MPDNTADNKAESKELNIRRKAVGALILMLVLFIPVSSAIYFLGRFYCWQQEMELEELNQEVLSRLARHGNRRYLAAEADFDNHIRKQIELTVSFLQDYVTEDGYNGPEEFPDGFVVRFDHDRAVFPAGVSGIDASVDRSLIEDSLRSGTVRTALTDMGSLSFGRISDDAVYVQITPEEEDTRILTLYRENIRSALETATEMSGRMTLLAYEENGRPVQLDQFGDPLLENGVRDLGLTMEILDSKNSGLRKIDGKRYRYTCTKADGAWLGYGSIYIIQVFLLDRLVSQMLLLTVMICLLMLVFYITIITYGISEEAYVQRKVLGQEEAERYNPKRLRRRFWCAGTVSSILILVIAYLTQSVVQMRQQTANGKHILQLLSGQRDRTIEGVGETMQEVRENWYLQYGSSIARFLEDCPEERQEEQLRRCCEITGADYIMLFDHEGHEILCSKDYDDFSIDRGLGENSSDFRRLLYGIEGIVHPVSTDSMTGLERQMIGVTTDCAGDSEHGALILALMPGTTAMREEEIAEEESSMLVPAGTLCFEADKATGEILYASEPAMEGKNVEDVGLTANSLVGGYMDFGNILGIQRFIVATEEESSRHICYYAADKSLLRTQNLLYGMLAAGIYSGGLLILLAYLLREYNDETYRRWAAFAFDSEDDDPGEGRGRLKKALGAKLRSGLKRTGTEEAGDEPAEKNFFVRISGWDTMLPERRARMVFTIGLFILLQLWVVLMLGSYLLNGAEQTLLDYLLNGDWMHGFNIFALYSILLSMAAADLVIMVSSWLLQLIAGFLDAKGETVCRLLGSLIKVVAILIVIVMAFNNVGLLNSRVLASMGIGSLAISLGAKDIIADVLTGILIVFNETVRVGDIVEYQGITAKVLDVKIQNTQLSTLPDNDILIVRNQAITSIINKSRTASLYSLKLQVRADTSLEKIEALMEEALPKMPEECPQIIGTPEYIGVVALGHVDIMDTFGIPAITLQVNAHCSTKDKFTVMLYMNRELHMLFAREGIEVF